MKKNGIFLFVVGALVCALVLPACSTVNRVLDVFESGIFDDAGSGSTNTNRSGGSTSTGGGNSGSTNTGSTDGTYGDGPTMGKLEFVPKPNDKNPTQYYVRAANTLVSGAIVIPGTYNGLPVTQVDDGAFLNNVTITSVVIPSSITRLRDGAFAGCRNLVTVVVQSGAIGFYNAYVIPGDFRAKYQASGPGTYVREAGGEVWTKR